MGKTIGDIITYVDSVIPNKITEATKIIFLSDLLGEGDFRKFNPEIVQYDTYTVADQSEYDLPASIKVKDLLYLGVSPTTYNSTDVVGSTTLFQIYKYYGQEDSQIGQRYTNYTSQLSLIPTPDDSYHMRMKYRPFYGAYSASSDSTTIIEADNNLINYLQNKVAARICKSMAFPRIDMGNNYEIDAEMNLNNARLNYYKTRRAESNRNISYKRWW